MVEILKKALAIFERLNDLSKHRVLSINEIREQRENIIEFEALYDNLKNFLEDNSDIDPNEVEKIKTFFSEIRIKLYKADWYINEIRTIGGQLSSNFIPPDTTAALLYAISSSNKPLEIAALEQKLEPLEYLKIKQEIFPFKDFDILLPVFHGFIVNYDHDGILIIDEKITTKDFMPLEEEVFFDHHCVFKKFDAHNAQEVVLFCPENQYFLWLNVKTRSYRKIASPKELLEMHPLKTYYWKNAELIIYNKEEFYIIDTQQGTMHQASEITVRTSLPKFYAYCMDAYDYAQYEILHAYPETYQFIFRDHNKEKFWLRDSALNTTVMIDYFDELTNDIQIYDDYIFFIQEGKIDIRKNKIKKTTIIIDNSYRLLKVCPFKKAELLYVMCLAKHVAMGRSSSLVLYCIAETYDDLLKVTTQELLNNQSSLDTSYINIQNN